MPDVLPGYWQCTIPLGPDPDDEGDIVATLVGRGPQTGKARGDTTGAHHTVLAVHGYTDYFFHTELADHFANRGFAFYALDLRKCGRSRAPGQTPHFITDLARYDTELEHSLSIINEQNRSAKVLVYGHPPAGSSCRCGWTGCASAARSPARGSPAWCSIARSWICKARQSCACR